MYPVDLHVALWTGNAFNTYFVTDPLKTRTIKSIIQHNTGQGTGSMFVVAPHLMPQPREQSSYPEWLMALHALNNERIYTFPPADREAALVQVHLERTDATEQYEAMYGPHVRFEKIHFGRVSIKPRYIKGFWIIAHLGREAFWQAQRQARYTPPPRRQYNAPPPSSSSASSTSSASGSSQAASSHSRPKTRLEASFEILGIGVDASHEEVKAAFRRQVFSVHPDVSALPKFMAEEKFRVLSEAYEYIKVERGWS